MCNMRQYFYPGRIVNYFADKGALRGILKRRAFFIFRNFLLTEGCPICIIVLETQYNNTVIQIAFRVEGRQKDLYLQKRITGRYEPGSRLPSVRELAGEASVNPNTMQKALTELEGSGLIYAVRTSGRFITEDESKIASERSRLAGQRIEEFLRQMGDLRIGKQEVIELIRQARTGD